MNETLLKDLSQIIKDYRADEIGYPLNEQHVRNWINQFDEDCRDIILKETVHVFQKWYFDETQIEKFIDSVLSFLCKQHSISELDLIKKVVFLSTQKQGNSQTRIIEKLRKMIRDQYDIEISTTGEAPSGIYVYLDDGLFTGIKARRDISSILAYLPSGTSLYVFYLIAARDGLNYSQKILRQIAEKNSIQITMLRMNELENVRTEIYDIDENGKIESSHHPIEHSCLWPTDTVKEIESVRKYISAFIDTHEKREKYLFRQEYWKKDKGIFTSSENRAIVEKEFLRKGIKLAEHSSDKGLYPLGFNAWPSLGFGSFCATYMNISNTCPLVLWWGNVEKKGDFLDLWYPLLPRRIEGEREDELFEEPIEIKKVFHKKDDQYNMCPDCGRYFGIMNDGGNGFCIDCAWKH